MTDENLANASHLPPALLQGRFGGLSEFAQLIRDALAVAAAQGWKEIILCDPSFADWPLGERAVAESLNDWSKSGRKFTMLAGHYDEVLRKHARFVTWRRTWSHLIECRGTGTSLASDLPSALWSPGWVLERLDLERCNGIAGSEPARRVALKERLAEKIARSAPAFPSTTLGI